MLSVFIRVLRSTNTHRIRRDLVSDTCHTRSRHDTEPNSYIKLRDFIKLLTVLAC